MKRKAAWLLSFCGLADHADPNGQKNKGWKAVNVRKLKNISGYWLLSNALTILYHLVDNLLLVYILQCCQIFLSVSDEL